ncbi:MAG TPA: PilZ domain-containing protein [Sphingomicrobium sp.]
MLDEQPVETTLYSLDDEAPGPPQRRESERHLSLLQVGALVLDDRRELCLIKNVSAGGMMLRVYSGIIAATRVTVELKQGESLSGTVRWVNGDTVGVTFDSPIDVLALLAPPTEGPRPRMPRIAISCTAWVREGAEVYRTRATNISQGGICVEGSAALTLGAAVVVSLNGFEPLRGIVKWHEGDAYGIGFNRVLRLQELVDWLQEQHRQQRGRAA